MAWRVPNCMQANTLIAEALVCVPGRWSATLNPVMEESSVTRQQTKIRCWEHGDTARFRAAMNLEAHQRAVISDYREFPVPAHLADYFLCFCRRPGVCASRTPGRLCRHSVYQRRSSGRGWPMDRSVCSSVRGRHEDCWCAFASWARA